MLDSSRELLALVSEQQSSMFRHSRFILCVTRTPWLASKDSPSADHC